MKTFAVLDGTGQQVGPEIETIGLSHAVTVLADWNWAPGPAEYRVQQLCSAGCPAGGCSCEGIAEELESTTLFVDERGAAW